jgi:AraC-like DNA-binding protein
MATGGAFRVLLAELAAAGLDPARLCAESGIDPAVVTDPSRRFGVRALGRVLARAEAVSGDPVLGLHLAAGAAGRGVLAYVFRAQPTVERGLAEMARVASTLWDRDDALRIVRRGRDASVVCDFGDAVSRHAAEFVVARVALALRQSAAPPCEVRFRHAAAGPSKEYVRVLGAPVRFGCASTEVRVTAASLAQPLATANADAAAALAAGLGRGRAPRATSLAARLTRVIEGALAEGASIEREVVARTLGMSGKTLARRLADEQQGFRVVVERARRALAHRLVVDERLPLGEVASRVGFADQAAFGKAFRRWFGASPSELRARRRRA